MNKNRKKRVQMKKTGVASAKLDYNHKSNVIARLSEALFNNY